jgi:hypothetical protein
VIAMIDHSIAPVAQLSVATAERADARIKHLNQIELSRRWSLSPRTLERWRWLKQGPDYLKVGGRVVYRLQDIETFEAAQRRRLTRAPA